jgi:hypothetical protein
MNKVKLLFLSIPLLVLFACSLADVDDESDFSPTYDKFVGCWVSMENSPREEGRIEFIVKEEPFSSCREICFREDSTYTIRTKISKKTTTTFKNIDSSNVVVVNDSIFEAYGFEQDSSYVSQWGILYTKFIRGKAWVGSKGFPVFYDHVGFRRIIKNDVYYNVEYNLNHEYHPRGFYMKSHLGYVYGNDIAYRRSMQHDNCGRFGTYIDTTKYTLDSLRGM